MHDYEIDAVKEFHTKFKHPVRTPNKKSLNPVSNSDFELRKRLVLEEADEIADAVKNADLVELADGCADTLYVLAGSVLQLGRSQDIKLDMAAQVLLADARTRFKAAMETPEITNVDTAISVLEIVVRGIASAYNIPIEKVFNEVHRSNMSKVWPDGSVRKDEGGKVMKPDTYSPADIEGILYGKKKNSDNRG